jgi:hypothetical protein
MQVSSPDFQINYILDDLSILDVVIDYSYVSLS